MEYSRATQMKVGALVAIGIGLLFITVFSLGGSNIFISKYKLKVKLSQVTGLDKGSVVQLLGITVGNVEDIQIVESEDKNNVEVTMSLEESFQKQITEGSVAGVRTQGALGDKYIYITPGPKNNPPLPENAVLKAEGTTGLFDTIAENTENIEKVFKIIDEAHLLLKNINGDGRSALIMENLSVATQNFKEMSERGQMVMKEAQSSSASLSSILQKVNTGSGTLGALINDRSVFDALKNFVGGQSQDKYMKNILRETIQSTDK